MLLRKGAPVRPLSCVSAPRLSLRAALLMATGLLLAWLPVSAGAEVIAWSERPTFTNRVDYTLDISCSDGGLVCDALDAYIDTKAVNVSGTGDVDLDLLGGTLQFLQDGTQDVGSGPQPSYATLDVNDITFAEIPFVGAPTTDQGVIFALTNPLFDAGQPLAVGTYPVSAVVSYSAFADIVGPVDAWVPEILLTPSDVTLSGELQITALLPGGQIAFSLNDLTGTLEVANPTTLLGEDVVVTVTADMALNLSGNNFTPGTTPLPALGAFANAALCAFLAGLGALAARRRAGLASLTRTGSRKGGDR